MMKQIIFVTGAMGRGGAERVISLLSGYYAQLGWRVSVVMLLHNKVEYSIHPEVEIVDLSNESVKAVLDMPRLIWKLHNLVKKRKPDAVVSFMAQNCLIAGMACAGLDTRLIMSERIDPSALDRGTVYEAVLNWAYANSSAVVFQTDRVRGYFPEKVRRNSMIIPNPIQVKVQALENPRHRIVTAGRLEKQKNHKMLIDAFANIHARHPQYTLDIYGEGTLFDALQKQIDALGLSDAAVLRGNVPDVHEQIMDAEIFVLPSDFEGLSNALLEAMMMGLPCISTDCAGSDEVIRHGENGMLIHVGDKAGLECALEKLICDHTYAKNLGRNAREESVRYSVDVVMKQWREAIEG